MREAWIEISIHDLYCTRVPVASREGGVDLNSVTEGRQFIDTIGKDL